MRLLICGDRLWTDKELIRRVVQNLEEPPEVIIEGDCKGADRLAGQVAVELKIPLLKYPANWKEYGKAAGHVRNQQMIDEGKPDLVIAFHDDIQESKGTADMVNRSMKFGIQVLMISHADAKINRVLMKQQEFFADS